MSKMPSYLKGLVESRARFCGDVERLEPILAEVTAQLADARKRLAAADIMIRDYSHLLDPTAIQPVRARKGKYGGHGNLKLVVRQILEAANGVPLPSAEVGLRVAIQLGLTFLSIEEQRVWAHGCVNRELIRQMRTGQVERLQGDHSHYSTHWRIKPEAEVLAGGTVTGLDGLRELAGKG